MAQMCLHDELLNEQQEALSSFMELLKKAISQNSQQVQSLTEQYSSDLPKSIQEQVQELIREEKQNTFKIQVLENLQREATLIAKEEHFRLEEARLNLMTSLTSEAENYGDRPKTISCTKTTPFVPSTLPLEAVAPLHNSHSSLR